MFCIAIENMIKVTMSLKSSKAFGPDNIPAIIWKDENFHELLLNLCNYTLSTFKSPKIWHQSQIILMPEKRDLSLVINYRGISLMAIVLHNFITFNFQLITIMTLYLHLLII